MASDGLRLGELLRLAFARPVEWIVPPDQKAPPVEWVALDPARARVGDLLLLPSSGWDAQRAAEAVERNLAGVLLVGDRPAALPACEVPLAVLTDPTLDVRGAQRRLLTLLINQQAALMERGARIHTRLSQVVAEGGGLTGLVQKMAEIAGRGVVVQDKRLNILAAYPAGPLQSIWGEVMALLTDAGHLPAALRDRKQAAAQPQVLETPLPGNLTRLIGPIVVGDRARGYLSLVGVANDLDALDRLVVHQGMLVCAVEMARAKAVRETEKRLKGDLLAALLRADLSPRDARLWLQSMGLDIEQPHAALRFAWRGGQPPSRRRLETLVNGEVQRLGVRAIVHPMGPEVVCFCAVDADIARPETALELGQAVQQQGREEYSDAAVACGIGKPAREVAEWRRSFQQAGQALDLAQRLNADAPLYFPDLSVYRLLLQLEHNPELVAFQEEILGPLLAYEGGEELIRTLEAYFAHHGNLSQAASALYIHRNTLLYRMERIARITGLNLENPDTRLAVQLALRIYRMLDRPGGLGQNAQ